MGIFEKKIVSLFKVFGTPFCGNICLTAFNNFHDILVQVRVRVRKRNQINAPWYGYGLVLKKASTGTGRVRVEMKYWCVNGTGT